MGTGAYKLKFDERALLFGMIGNSFAAFKGSENKKLMTKEGIKERMGGVANQFALTEILGFLISLPVMILTEWTKFPEFWRYSLPARSYNRVCSSLASLFTCTMS